MTQPFDVALLTTAHCVLCDHAKAVLVRVGKRYRLRIVEIDLRNDDGRQLAERAGVVFAPGVLVDGQLVAFGRLSERRLIRELDRRLAARTT